MKHRRRKVSTGTARSVGGQILALSLFIMLLAFFIILNAISTLEETRIDPVMRSLSEAFATRVDQTDLRDSPSDLETPEKSIHHGSVFERIDALFSAQMPSYQVHIDERNGEMYVRVPYRVFESAVLATLQGNALEMEGEQAAFLPGFFAPTLVALMQGDADQDRPVYRMDMILNIRGNPSHLRNQNPQRLAGHIGRITDLSDRLEEAGLQENLMSAGLMDGESDMMDLLFRRHVPYSPVDERESRR